MTTTTRQLRDPADLHGRIIHAYIGAGAAADVGAGKRTHARAGYYECRIRRVWGSRGIVTHLTVTLQDPSGRHRGPKYKIPRADFIRPNMVRTVGVHWFGDIVPFWTWATGCDPEGGR